MAVSKCCGSCKWCHKDELNDLICVNGNSEYVTDYVDEEHSCCDFEEKDIR